MVREFRRINSGRDKFIEGFIFGKAFQYPEPLNSEIETKQIAKIIHNGVKIRVARSFQYQKTYFSGCMVFPTSSIVNPAYTIIEV